MMPGAQSRAGQEQGRTKRETAPCIKKVRSIDPVQVEVWSDIQCIWCYIAAPRLQKAIDRFDGGVEVTYRSFLLTPDAPLRIDREAEQRRHQTSNPQFDRIMAQLTELTAAEGLQYRPDLTQPTNSRSAMELLHHADTFGQRPAMTQRLFQAYFVEGRHLGSVDELSALAADIDLNPDETAIALAEHRYRSVVDADIATARRSGATGAPFYIVNNQWGIAGAQSTDTYLELLHKAVQA